MNNTLIVILVACAPVCAGMQQAGIGDVPDGNRTTSVHLLKLYDESGHLITPDDRPLMPFSPKQTCGKCHDYGRISRGWHFNAADSLVRPGRNGEPWILVDPGAAMQVPVSYRKWAGTYRPSDLGLSSFGFLTTFGHHLPGGGVGEISVEPEEFMRSRVSGPLEVNCQSCHNADPAQSQAEYGMQVLRQNFRWAAAASSGFAVVRGSALDMPDSYDMYSAVPPGESNKLPPTVTYAPSRLDASDRVLFSVPRKMPAGQCAFCHSSKVIDPDRKERWEGEEDVHVAAGMLCVDCHRNGIDHEITRGFEGEADLRNQGPVASFTCRGCHLGTGAGDVPRDGRRGAPRPEHRGIPPVHFETMACTACHSGPWPGEITYAVKTSRAHALGIPKADKSDDALPHIVTPVFARGSDGRLAPHDLIWPAFWAYTNNGTLSLVPPARVRPIVSSVLLRDTTRRAGKWPILRESEILGILGELSARDTTAGEPLYVSGGMIYSISRGGTLTKQTGDAARPYAWPIAHDVRPRSQSLGIRGCGDCHATDAPFHFGVVKIASPYVLSGDSLSRMTDYQGVSPVSAWLFSMSFLFRPGLKLIIILCFGLIGWVVVLQVSRGLLHIIRRLAGDDQ